MDYFPIIRYNGVSRVFVYSYDDDLDEVDEEEPLEDVDELEVSSIFPIMNDAHDLLCSEYKLKKRESTLL